MVRTMTPVLPFKGMQGSVIPMRKREVRRLLLDFILFPCIKRYWSERTSTSTTGQLPQSVSPPSSDQSPLQKDTSTSTADQLPEPVSPPCSLQSPKHEDTGTSTTTSESQAIDMKDMIKNCQEMIQGTISKTTPLLLSSTAGKAKCCIFKVSDTFIGNSYQPSVVSIGPYHHGKPNLKMIEEHKWRYLGSLLSRTKTSGKTLSDYLLSIKPLEADAKECYSEAIQIESDKFLEIMVLDGCFILEIFRKVNNPQLFEQDDPIATMAWILPSFCRDFLRLENQIPFFILEKLFEISKITDEEFGTSLSLLALRFFNKIMHRPQHVIDSCGKLGGKHLLDLVHSSYTHDLKIPPPRKGTRPPIMLCISKLRRSGIKINQVEKDSFLAVKFKNGVIEMPTLTIDEFMCSFLVNCLALEQYHHHISKHFTAYAILLDCLVESNKDVGYLCDCNIVENDYGTDAEVARFINTMGKDVVFDIDECYLSELFNDVDRYYRNCWNVQWTIFKRKYFNTPWSFISALAAFVLLLFTFAQTFYAIYGYHVHPK